jgi:large subunit ribosomal protein L6
MSRVGRLPVKVPSGVTVSLRGGADGTGGSVELKGPRGAGAVALPNHVRVEQKGGELVVLRSDDSREARALHGLTRKHLANIVEGVSKGFSRVLEISGVGYRAELRGSALFLTLGYSHPILFQLPPGVTAKVDRQVVITLEGHDRQVLGATAAAIRKLRPPEPYKGKGIKYAEEKIRRKSGKAAGAAA